MTALDPAPTFTPVRSGFDWGVLRERWVLVLLLISAALIGPIGYAGQLGYAALVGLAGIGCLPLLGVKRAPMWEILVLVALVLWAMVTMGWSLVVPAHPDFHRYKQIEGVVALKLPLELALYGALVFAMREAPASWAGRVMATLSVGLVAIAVLMAIDALTGQAVYRGLRLSAHAVGKAEMIESKAARGCYTLALFFWPAALWMRRAGWTAPLVVLVVGLVVAAIGLKVDTPLVAVALGGLALLAVRLLGRPAIWVLLGGTVVYFALAPTIIDLLGPHLPAIHDNGGIAKESWGARVAIWRFAAGKIAEQPWFGWGIDSSRMFEPIPLHPHSAAMQVWLELGMVGAALAALFWAWLWARIGAVAERSRSDAGLFAAVAVAYLVIGALSFGVWQEWWLALGALAVVICGVFRQAFPDWRDEAGLQELQPIA